MRFPKLSSFGKMVLQTVDYFFHFNNYLSVKLPSMQAMEHVFVSASGSLRGLHRFFAFSLNTILPSNVKFELNLSMKQPRNEFIEHKLFAYGP